MNDFVRYLLDTFGPAVLISAIATFIGGLIVRNWQAHLQAANDQQLARLRQEFEQLNLRTRATLDHAVTVSRAQWEVEFAALRDIWTRAARVRADVGAINTPFPPENETEPERLARFYKARGEFVDAHNALIRAIDDNSPFYPPEIYAVVDSLRLRTGLETTQLNTRRPPFDSEGIQHTAPVDWYKQRELAHEQIKALVDAVSEVIRQRLASITIRE